MFAPVTQFCVPLKSAGRQETVRTTTHHSSERRAEVRRAGNERRRRWCRGRGRGQQEAQQRRTSQRADEGGGTGGALKRPRGSKPGTIATKGSQRQRDQRQTGAEGSGGRGTGRLWLRAWSTSSRWATAASSLALHVSLFCAVAWLSLLVSPVIALRGLFAPLTSPAIFICHPRR